MSENPPPGEAAPPDTTTPRDGRRLRLVTTVWAVLMALAIVMIVLMLRS
ncbi:hypothetical protein ACWGR4_02195 [Embleya sp. NPDC055664]